MTKPPCSMSAHGLETAEVACGRPSSPAYMGRTFTWTQRTVWSRAAKNTVNCLIGCMIGDFGALIVINTWFPETPVMLTMAIAMTSGLITSVLFETGILRVTEGFGWKQAVRTAFSMSFLSMLGMELAANATDFAITGGDVPTSEPLYWVALGISLVVGFLAPLPYNYWKLARYGKACH